MRDGVAAPAERTGGGNLVETYRGDTALVVPGPPSTATSALRLRGFSVGIAAERHWQEQAEVLGALGARVVHGPVVGPMPLVRRESLEVAVDELAVAPPDAVVFVSAAGVESWLAWGECLGSEGALGAAVARAKVFVGADARGAAEAGGMAVAAVLPAATEAMVGEVVASLHRRVRVVVQLDGGGGERVADALQSVGFDVVAVPRCPAVLPEDPTAALALVEAVAERRVDAVTFTTAAEVHNLVAIAASVGLDEAVVTALCDDVVPACRGTRCAAAATAVGMSGLVHTEAARSGAMLDALATRLADSVVRLRLHGTDVEVRGQLALVTDDEVWLTTRERALLAALARRPGAVVAKADLLRRVWGSDGIEGADGHAVEVAVARLRRRLGSAGAGLVTVPRRGYRLVAD